MELESTPPEITLQAISVRSDGGSHEGRLVFVNGDLLAVFTRITAEENAPGSKPGWFLEAGFGPCSSLMAVQPPVFASLDEAVAWVRGRLQAGLSSS